MRPPARPAELDVAGAVVRRHRLDERMSADRVGRGDVENLVSGEIRLDREDDGVAEVVHVDVRAVVLDQDGRVADDRPELRS